MCRRRLRGRSGRAAAAQRRGGVRPAERTRGEAVAEVAGAARMPPGPGSVGVAGVRDGAPACPDSSSPDRPRCPQNAPNRRPYDHVERPVGGRTRGFGSLSHHEQMGGKRGAKAGSASTAETTGKATAKAAPAKPPTTKKTK